MLFLQELIKLNPQFATHTGTHIKIKNPGYLPLSIENIASGPRDMPAISICHYGEQNGDLMRDPEMCFEMEIEDGQVKEFHAYYYRNDYAAFEQNAIDEDTKAIDASMIRNQREFAETWSRNLFEQGFFERVRAALS